MSCQEITDYIINTEEYELLGQGAFASAFELPNNKVLKIFPMDRPNFDFIKIIENLDLPYFPKVFKIKRLKNIGISIMERLEHINNEITDILQDEDIYIDELFSCAETGKFNKEIFNTIPQLENITKAIIYIREEFDSVEFALGKAIFWDLHYANYMVRPSTGEFVLVDPWD